MIKTCEICGKEFDTNYKHKKYCSKECSKQGKVLTDRKYRNTHKTYWKRYYLEHKEEHIARCRAYRKLQHSKKTECSLAHDGCFECPTPDGECLYN